MPKSLNPLPAAASRFINHLVSQAPWAQDSLRAHGGKTALFDIGAVLLRLQVTADGLVAPAVPDVADTASDAPQSAPDVTIALRAADLPLIAANPDRAVSYVKISGDADFANTISALSRGLRWDAGLDLSKFFGHKGRLLMYHGWSDQLIAPGNSIDYYNSVGKKAGGVAKIDQNMRLFMAPGMAHCNGGDGPNTFDAVTLLEQWVEQGKAPDKMIATHATAGKADRSRPLCPYPQTAVYNGSGDTNDAANFSCKVQ